MDLDARLDSDLPHHLYSNFEWRKLTGHYSAIMVLFAVGPLCDVTTSIVTWCWGPTALDTHVGLKKNRMDSMNPIKLYFACLN